MTNYFNANLLVALTSPTTISTVASPDDTAYATATKQIAEDLEGLSPPNETDIRYVWSEDEEDDPGDTGDRVFRFETSEINYDSNQANQLFNHVQNFNLVVLLKNNGDTNRAFDRRVNAEAKAIMTMINLREYWPSADSHSVQDVDANISSMEFGKSEDSKYIFAVVVIACSMFEQTEN